MYMDSFSPYNCGTQPMQNYYPNNVLHQTLPSPIPNNVPQASPSLYGKIVDGIETAKAQEVPIGQSGIYPKADGTSVFIKSWNSDGSTKVDEYQKISSTEDKIENDYFSEILKRINSLEEKLDSIKPSTTTRKKKIVEVDEDE